MSTKQNNNVTIVKWTGQEPGAYCSGILGVFAKLEDAQHFMKTSAANLVETGYLITRRNDKEYRLVRKSTSEGITDNLREMHLYLETHKIQ